MNEPVIRYSCSFRTLGSSREESRRRSLARRELRREKDMRKIALTLTAAAGIVGAVSLSSNRAEATILDASAAIHQATEDTSLAQPANYSGIEQRSLRIGAAQIPAGRRLCLVRARPAGTAEPGEAACHYASAKFWADSCREQALVIFVAM
jgi:hypothetical protein